MNGISRSRLTDAATGTQFRFVSTPVHISPLHIAMILIEPFYSIHHGIHPVDTIIIITAVHAYLPSLLFKNFIIMHTNDLYVLDITENITQSHYSTIIIVVITQSVSGIQCNHKYSKGCVPWCANYIMYVCFPHQNTQSSSILFILIPLILFTSGWWYVILNY